MEQPDAQGKGGEVIRQTCRDPSGSDLLIHKSAGSAEEAGGAGTLPLLRRPDTRGGGLSREQHLEALTWGTCLLPCPTRSTSQNSINTSPLPETLIFLEDFEKK